MTEGHPYGRGLRPNSFEIVFLSMATERTNREALDETVCRR